MVRDTLDSKSYEYLDSLWEKVQKRYAWKLILIGGHVVDYPNTIYSPYFFSNQKIAKILVKLMRRIESVKANKAVTQA